MKAGHLLQFLLFAISTNIAWASDDKVEPPASASSARVEVVFDTTMGSFTVQLEPEKAPATVANFLRYVDAGFYRDTLFHRVIPNFMAQGGGFSAGPKHRQPHLPAIKNESSNGLRNVRGSIAMARSSEPDSATAQFFINVVHNFSLDSHGDNSGYTVFGKVVDGMSVIDDIVAVQTTTVGRLRDVPESDIVVLSARRATSSGVSAAAEPDREPFQPNVHYVVLDSPVATQQNGSIEVVQAFAYGCPHCFAFDSLAAEWRNGQSADVDFRRLPAVWNETMRIFAQVFYSAEQLGVAEQIHMPLYNALIVEQQKLTTESALASWFSEYGVEPAAFLEVFHSAAVTDKVAEAETRTRDYQLGNVPQIVVNGKYRIDAMRAGGRSQMLAVVGYLVDKERELVNR